MVTASPLFSSSVALTMGIASLASDTNLVAGRESTAVDQKDVDDAVDVLVGGKVTTGTSPTASRQIEIWLYGSYDDTEFGGAATGTDNNLTPSVKTSMKLLEVIPTTSTSNQTYKWGPYSVAAAFGGCVPVQWGCFIVHNTGVALNATASNHEVVRFPVKYESA
jgi:hypothetical protein